MATSFSFVLLLQLLCLFLQTNGAIVDIVCGQTKNPSLCSSSLGSDPRSKSAALPQLAQIAIDMAEYDATQAKIKIHSYLISAKIPKLKGLYAQCENLYLDALGALRDAPAQLEGRQYGELSKTGVRVRAQVDGCEAAFNNNSPFKPENQLVGVLADAIVVIANKSLLLF
ncbi:pectinesterase inhibitor [Phtheirospermum japonicum]|uniref:Pectinesterase inhibitor n=1 Tax=Phtheirospermum japonicum TaxID=374723 RepID=A0A830CRQ3_9LAMI|nr:pectinesterase inhibitor [Phtheirospermum japonicum]